MSVNSRLPHPVVKTKAGKVAKRQPPYNERPKSYYQAQCSFRGLKTSGTKEELQQLLRHRDVSKDLIIERELDQLQSDKRIYENEQEVARFEQWWKDPTTAFEDKLQQRSQRALQEEMGKPDSFLLRSCRIYRGHRYDLSRAAANLSLGYVAVQGPTDLPPGAEIQRCQIIGEAEAVAAQAKTFIDDAEKKALEQWASWSVKVGAEKAAKRMQRQVFLNEAKTNDDWDLTGDWTVHCDPLAQYSSEQREDLHMQIFKDDYKLDAVCADKADSEDEYYEDEDDNRPADDGSKPESATDSRRPRYCAKFSFGVVESTMRIYPLSSEHSSPD
jgi:hypothetical protein